MSKFNFYSSVVFAFTMVLCAAFVTAKWLSADGSGTTAFFAVCAAISACESLCWQFVNRCR